ncbi:MAG: hypothetical protein ACYTGE_17360, partial [Planctomycetota bacterium]
AGSAGRLSTNALKRIRCSPASETVDWVRQWLAAASSNSAVHELDPGGAILAIPRLDTEVERGVPGPRFSGGRSLVVPVETAGLADLNDLADLRRLHSPGLREHGHDLGFDPTSGAEQRVDLQDLAQEVRRVWWPGQYPIPPRARHPTA